MACLGQNQDRIDELLTRFKLNDFRKYKAHNLIWVFYACRGEFTLDFRGKLRHGPLVPSPCPRAVENVSRFTP